MSSAGQQPVAAGAADTQRAQQAQHAEQMLAMQAALAQMMKSQAATEQRIAALLAREANAARLQGSTQEGLDAERVEQEAQEDARSLQRAVAAGTFVPPDHERDRGEERKQSDTDTKEARRQQAIAAVEAELAREARDLGRKGHHDKGETPAAAAVAAAAAAAAAVAHQTGASLLRGKVPEPVELQDEKAREPEVLERWIFAVERMCDAADIDTSQYAEMRRYAKRYIGFGVARWLAVQEQMLATKGEAPASWMEFTRMLRDHYTPISDEATAFRELQTLRQRPEESMQQYVQRASTLVARISPVNLSEQMAGQMMQNGGDRVRFPMALRDVELAQQEHRKAHGGASMPFHAVGNTLQQAAAREPVTRTGAQPSAPSGASRRPGQYGSTKARITALLQEVDSEDEEEIFRRVAAVSEGAEPGTRPAKSQSCSKCGGANHAAFNCRSKVEKRSCFNCGKTGHLKPNCPEKATTAGVTGKPAPKNE